MRHWFEHNDKRHAERCRFAKVVAPAVTREAVAHLRKTRQVSDAVALWAFAMQTPRGGGRVTSWASIDQAFGIAAFGQTMPICARP